MTCLTCGQRPAWQRNGSGTTSRVLGWATVRFLNFGRSLSQEARALTIGVNNPPGTCIAADPTRA